ncbi:MAG: GyrI-like domain-containing protein [Cyclobacteriaceae bacterium]
MEATLSKIDLIKIDPNYYNADLQPEIKDFDTYYYLSLEGKSAPEHVSFLNAIEAMYGVAYGVKFLCKGEDNDFVVPKMECHWYIDGGLENQHEFVNASRNEWRWKILFRMPDFVEADHFFRALESAKSKKPELFDVTSRIKFELINEGKCVQIMHIGSWEQEQTSLKKVFDLIQSENLSVTGYHKEIYISDPRKVAEEKKKTILRYQVK